MISQQGITGLAIIPFSFFIGSAVMSCFCGEYESAQVCLLAGIISLLCILAFNSIAM